MNRPLLSTSIEVTIAVCGAPSYLPTTCLPLRPAAPHATLHPPYPIPISTWVSCVGRCGLAYGDAQKARIVMAALRFLRAPNLNTGEDGAASVNTVAYFAAAYCAFHRSPATRRTAHRGQARMAC